MKHLKTFENHIPEHMSENSSEPESVIQKYIQKYPEYSEFFTNFIEEYPDGSSFKAAILGACEGEYESDEESYEDSDEYVEGSGGLTDDEIIDKYWYPELEVYVLESDLNCDFPGGDIWVEFHTDMINSEWGKK